MTRITLWTLSTLSVLVLLFGYHTSTEGVSVSSTPPAVVSGSIAGSSTSSSSGTSGSTDSGSSGAGSADTGPTDSTESASSTGTFTGVAADTRWGPVQVAITVSGGAITDVQVPVYPTGNHKDEEINSYALPVLIQSTLEAQGSDIDMVSGATVTSVGYEQSLQSALDQAGM